MWLIIDIILGIIVWYLIINQTLFFVAIILLLFITASVKWNIGEKIKK